MNQSKKQYHYIFDNGERHTMTPIDAHKYADRKKIKIIQGPNYSNGRKERSFQGWGYHDSLKMTFKGPQHYREYLRANGMEEWGDSEAPQFNEYRKPKWDEDLIRRAINVHGMEIGSVLAEALLSGELDYPDGSTNSTNP